MTSASGKTYHLATTTHTFDIKVRTDNGIKYFEIKATTATGRMRYFFQQSELDAAHLDTCPSHSYYHVLVSDVEGTPNVALFRQK